METQLNPPRSEPDGAIPTPKATAHLIDLPEPRSYRIKRKLLGPPLETSALEHERLGIPTGLAVFASDNISSSAYATEEILHVLIPVIGALAFSLVLPITIAMCLVLFVLVLSYRQTIKEYPTAGGAYMVTRDNFGLMPAQIAGVSLLTDYILTVSVSVAAGTAALASFFHSLTPYSVVISVFFVGILAFGNLKGVKDSGKIFAVPTYFFVVMMVLLLAVGLWKSATGGLHAQAIEGLSGTIEIGHAGTAEAFLYGAGIFVVLHAFASGGAAVTGVEAISNGVTAFRKPEWMNARKTLVIMGSTLGVLFLGLSFLATKIHPVPYEDGVPTVISQIGKQVFGASASGQVLYALLQAGTILILVMAANTGFADFPRLASFHAGDNFMPRQLAKRGHRLVFSNGIIFLALSSAVLLIVTNAEVSRLIPLYAIGVFTSFTLSQAGMARHHLRKKEQGWKSGIVINGIGAVMTFVVAVVILLTKFTEGAWVIVILIPVIVWGLYRLNHNYEVEEVELERDVSRRTAAVSTTGVREHTVVVMVDALDVPADQALQYARTLLPDRLKAVHLDLDPIRTMDLVDAWGRLGYTKFPLEVVNCPDRRSDRAAAEFIARELIGGNIDVTVLIPRRVYRRGWHRLMHDHTANAFAKALSGLPHCTVTFVPYLMGSTDGEATLVRPLDATASSTRSGRSGNGTNGAHGGTRPDLHDADGRPRISTISHREHVRVTGEVHAMKVQPLRGTPTFELTIVDETGALAVVFFGRRSIAGIRPGVMLTVEGAIGEHQGRLAMLNPSYEILIPSTHELPPSAH